MTAREVLALLSSLEGEITAAYLADVLAIKDAAVIAELEIAVAAQDAEGVMRAAGFRPDSWGSLEASIATAYARAGRFYIAGDVPARFGMAFDWRNPAAEQWLRDHTVKLSTELNTSQLEAIQETLRAGMQAGRNPRNVALDIVGRVNRATGRREGGIIGLNEPQTQAAINARQDLENLDNRYFTRQRRDRRFDDMVKKAIKSGTPLTQTDINRIVGRYEDRLLALRGETLSRTEALAALNSAADESLRQVVEQGLAPPEAVKRIWRHSYSAEAREGHKQMSDEKQTRGIDEPFVNPVTEAVLMHPGDGPVSEIANCKCWVQHDIDFVAVELAR